MAAVQNADDDVSEKSTNNNESNKLPEIGVVFSSNDLLKSNNAEILEFLSFKDDKMKTRSEDSKITNSNSVEETVVADEKSQETKSPKTCQPKFQKTSSLPVKKRAIDMYDTNSKDEIKLAKNASSNDETDEFRLLCKGISDPSFSKPKQRSRNSTETTEDLMEVLKDDETDIQPEKMEVNDEEAAGPSCSNEKIKGDFNLKNPLLVLDRIDDKLSEIKAKIKEEFASVRKSPRLSEQDIQKIFEKSNKTPSSVSNKENRAKSTRSSSRSKSPLRRKKQIATKKTYKSKNVSRNCSKNNEDQSFTTNSNSTFQMQTRKRVLKFLPDGSLVTPKNSKSYSNTATKLETDSSLDDSYNDSDSGSDSDVKIIKHKKLNQPKTKPTPNKSEVSYKRFENEKLITSTGIKRKNEPAPTTPLSSFRTNNTSKLEMALSNSNAGKYSGNIDPAQLLSQLTNTKITWSDLEIHKFCPKILSLQQNSSIKPAAIIKAPPLRNLLPKPITPAPAANDSDVNEISRTSNVTERSNISPSPVKKQQPKPLSTPPSGPKMVPVQRSTTAKKGTILHVKPERKKSGTKKRVRGYKRVLHIKNSGTGGIIEAKCIKIAAKPLIKDSTKKITPADSANAVIYDKVTKTIVIDSSHLKNNVPPDSSSANASSQASPLVKSEDNNSAQRDAEVSTTGDAQPTQASDSDLNQLNAPPPPKSIYKLIEEINCELPSWNLHVLPDTDIFCIAQVGASRTGVPTLQKSIVLGADLTAQVFIHQFHCKRYDGVYADEASIVGLVREIDALNTSNYYGTGNAGDENVNAS